MRIRVKFFASFRELFKGKERELDLEEGTTIRKLLDVLCETSEEKEQIFKNGEIRPDVVVMKNSLPIASSRGLETELQEEDIVAIFPLMAGG